MRRHSANEPPGKEEKEKGPIRCFGPGGRGVSDGSFVSILLYLLCGLLVRLMCFSELTGFPSALPQCRTPRWSGTAAGVP